MRHWDPDASSRIIFTFGQENKAIQSFEKYLRRHNDILQAESSGEDPGATIIGHI